MKSDTLENFNLGHYRKGSGFHTEWCHMDCFFYLGKRHKWPVLNRKVALNLPFCWFSTLMLFFLLRSADKVGRPFCNCIFFSLLFLFYCISFPLSAFCDFSAIFHRIFLIFYQVMDINITCTTVVYIYGYEGQMSRSQGDTRWKCTVRNFSLLYHSIFFKFYCSVVLDKGTTWYKFQARRLKVKVMSTHPWQICCMLFSLLLFNEFQWNFAGI